MTYEDVSGVGDGGDDSGSNHELFPGLGEVHDVNTFVVTFVHVWSHQTGAVLSTDVALINGKIARKHTPAASIRAIS